MLMNEFEIQYTIEMKTVEIVIIKIISANIYQVFAAALGILVPLDIFLLVNNYKR